MNFIEWANSRANRLTIWDVGLIKGSCVAGGLLLAQLVPSLRRVDPRVLAAITLLLAVKPIVVTLKAHPSSVETRTTRA